MDNSFVNIVTILGILGIPSIFSISMWCFKCCRKYSRQLNILMKAQQAQMRTKLLELYYKYKERGYITADELDDWENQYQSYHELGKNGIMDSRRDELLNMPNKLDN